jgi:sensor histidine kinase YesM
MEFSADLSLQTGDAAQREEAKTRLYVISQTCGWGSCLALGAWVTIAFPGHDSKWGLSTTLAVMFMTVATGLLITHFLRPIMARWKWKELGWRALLPRIVTMSFAASAVWFGSLSVWIHVVVGLPWNTKDSIPLTLMMEEINGTILVFGWLCLYFFYHLFDRLNRSEVERFGLMTSVKEAELRALKSQVNPHFIFNSLNSLRALIDEDPARARKAVTQLANLLRYSLQSGQMETVPFEDELDIVNDYLALEQVRHEERLRLRLDIAPEALQLRIPPMLLQTLVENAVKYGISPNPEGGEITIVARSSGGALRIQVSNPGQIAGNGRDSSTGVGLRNAADRLRLIFGERATLQLRSDLQPAQVVAEAVIPLPAHG